MKAIAKVKSNAIPIYDNKELVSEFSAYNVKRFDKISYYDAEILVLSNQQVFKYKLQQGIVKVHLEKIKKKATELWLGSKAIPDKRIMRLTWNSNNWETPSGHSWRPENQGNTNIAYENQYGYGHEEWLFNERFRLDGYQYGYVRGVDGLSQKAERIDQITLYTIRDDQQRCLVGNLYNVEIIEGYEEELAKIAQLLESNHATMKAELKSVNADYRVFRKGEYSPNIKFKWNEAELFNEPFSVDFLDGPEFNRFMPYHLSEELEVLLKSSFAKKIKFDFQSGKASSQSEYTKTTSGKQSKVIRRHSEITDNLYDYLILKGFGKRQISVEKTRVGGAIVDVVLKQNDEFDLFEIKTSNTALKNIRQAIGQIFEYAMLDADITCNRLIIIGPARMSDIEKAYFERLKKLIQIDLEYWAYIPEEKEIKNKFKE
ncbi:hypothetical protein [Roseivirga sp.]|uniref:hypothetical protein n=1 Tax=Roseivirga sp. TaxID=1964215 RepID=UPI002B26FAB6|nr:hypothetical protein [Roseivirga sp.]